MDELKIIADMIGALGSEARFAFVAWLIAKYGGAFILGLAGITGATIGAVTVIRALVTHAAAYRVAKAVARKSGVGWWDAEDPEQVAKCIAWVENQK